MYPQRKSLTPHDDIQMLNNIQHLDDERADTKECQQHLESTRLGVSSPMLSFLV